MKFGPLEALNPRSAAVFCLAIVIGGVALYEVAYGVSNSNAGAAATTTTIQSGNTTTISESGTFVAPSQTVVASTQTGVTTIGTPNGLNSSTYTRGLDNPTTTFITIGDTPSPTLPNNPAWQMPANVLVSTTLNLTRAISGDFVITVDIVPVEGTSNSTVGLGLYIGGNLAAKTIQDFSNSNPMIPASMIGQPVSIGNSQIANFSAEFAAVQVALHSDISVPAGSVITLTEYSNSPTWILVDPTGTLTSYETTGPATISNTPPSLANAIAVPVPIYLQGTGIGA